MTLDLQPGSSFGAYVLDRRLGGGGFGDVWLSRDASGVAVALKVLHGQYQSSQVARLRAEIELLAAAASSSSSHIVRVLDGGSEPAPHVVMEYIDGTDLGREIARRGALPVAEVLRVAAGIADALSTLQQFAIIHRDIKPANVMIDAKSVVKLTDFGIAKIVGVDSVTTTNNIAMSVAYAAPEVFEGKASYQSDHYAFGALLFHLLTGHTLFSGNYVEIMRHHVLTPPDLTALPADVPGALRTLIAYCLAKAPEQRPANATALLIAVSAAEEEMLSQMGEATVIQPRLRPPRQLGPWVIDRHLDERGWLFECHNETSGEEAVVEVHFADDLAMGDALRTRGNRGASRFVLRPGEGWANAPSTRFSFWLARPLPTPEQPSTVIAKPRVETTPLTPGAQRAVASVPVPADVVPVAGAPVAIPVQAPSLADRFAAPSRPREDNETATTRKLVLRLKLYSAASILLIAVVLLESVHWVFKFTDSEELPGPTRIELFHDLAQALLPLVLAFSLLYAALRRGASSEARQMASKLESASVAFAGVIGILAIVGLIFSAITSTNDSSETLWLDFCLILGLASYCLGSLAILGRYFERYSAYRVHFIKAAVVVAVAGIGLDLVLATHFHAAGSLSFLSGAVGQMLRRRDVLIFLYAFMPIMTMSLLLAIWTIKEDKRAGLWLLVVPAFLLIVFLDFRSGMLLNRYADGRGGPWPFVIGFLQHLIFALCLPLAMFSQQLRTSAAVIMPIARGVLVLLCAFAAVGSAWLAFDLFSDNLWLFGWDLMRFLVMALLALILVEDLVMPAGTKPGATT